MLRDYVTRKYNLTYMTLLIYSQPKDEAIRLYPMSMPI